MDAGWTCTWHERFIFSQTRQKSKLIYPSMPSIKETSPMLIGGVTGRQTSRLRMPQVTAMSGKDSWLLMC